MAPGGLEGTATSNATVHTVTPPTDLGITKITSNPTPTAGGAAFNYTLTVTNNGPSNATDVVLTDPLPPGIIFQNLTIAPGNSGFSCIGPPVGQNGQITCTNANMAVAATATFTIVAQVVPNVASGVRFNTATVTSGTPEVSPDPTRIRRLFSRTSWLTHRSPSPSPARRRSALVTPTLTTSRSLTADQAQR